MSHTYIQVEEEAALINYYINSRKVKKEENRVLMKADTLLKNFKKTMKELIQESIAHVER